MTLAVSPKTTAFVPSADWEEKDLENEQQLFEKFAKKIQTYQRKDAEHGKPLRGFHAKIHVGVTGEFRVLPGLPEYACQGVFREPRAFPAVIRFSNGDSRLHEDTNPEPRGIAIKLIGVEGRKLLKGRENEVTQDFLATSHSVTSVVKDVRQFMAFVRAHRHFFWPVILFFTLGPREAIRILIGLKHTVKDSVVRSMATEHYSGTAPIKFGPYAVKFMIRPSEGGTAPPARRALTKDFLKEELAERLPKADLVFDFLVQFYVDKDRTPIEDTSVPWRPEDTPPLKVAELRIPRGNLHENCTTTVDGLSFSPWHAIEDHRPLGNVMRARRFAYEASAAFRGSGKPEPTEPQAVCPNRGMLSL